MPSFYPNSQQRPMALTPPEYLHGYNGRDGAGIPLSSNPYTQPFGHTGRQEKRSFDLLEICRGQSGYPPTGPPMYQAQHVLPPAYNPVPTAPPRSQYGLYGPIGAPVLPPVRAQDPIVLDDPMDYQKAREQHTVQERQAKEEKPIGGVAAHLDYEMDQMSDFVAEMSQGMYDLYLSRICLADIDMIRSVQPNSPVSPAFRKFVSQILTSTRLPSSTILLALYYLATRMNMLSAEGQYKASSGQMYRMLTIALLLGSKFLDDNTFQNRSWSEVSGLAVTELNSLEFEWLEAISWNLHVNPYEHQGFMSWKAHWDSWKSKIGSQARKIQTAAKSSPLSQGPPTKQSKQHVYSPATTLQPPPYSTAGMQDVGVDRRSSQYPMSGRYEPWNYGSPITDPSPPSAPETGPNTPEYLSLQGAWPFCGGPQSHQPLGTVSGTGRSATSLPMPYLPSHSQVHTGWQNHPIGCGCAYCCRPHEAYFFPSGFCAQTVMG